jgi:tetraacyldisaccharide 4'-kinase
LHRDVDIVLLAKEDLQDRVLPLGRLREGVETLGRADAIVMTGSGESADVGSGFSRICPDSHAAVFQATTSLGAPQPGPFLAVAGIARPRRFLDMLSVSGWQVVRTLTFRDHHYYSRADVARIAAAADEAGARAVVTTEKDLVRLLPLRPFPLPIVAAPLAFAIEPAVAFRTWLFHALGSDLKVMDSSRLTPHSPQQPPAAERRA